MVMFSTAYYVRVSPWACRKDDVRFTISDVRY